MIQIAYSTERQRPELRFKGDNFDELLALCRARRLEYDPDHRLWFCSAKKMLALIPALEAIESVKVDVSVFKELKAIEVADQETQFVRRIFRPDLLRGTPKQGQGDFLNYQLDGIKKGISQNRMALFHEMGTGKTYIQIGILNHLVADNEIDRLMVICPTEALINWKHELSMFSTFYSPEDVYVVNPKNRQPFDKKIVLCSYRSFVMLCEDAYKAQHGKRMPPAATSAPLETVLGEWGTKRAIVLDESHNIKNATAKQSKLVLRHRKAFHYRYIMTGTPCPNNFAELYPQMKFLDLSLVPNSYQDFLSEIANIGNKFSAYAVNFFYSDKVSAYEKKLQPYVLRVKATDAAKLPDLTFKKIFCEMPQTQQDIYELLANAVADVIKEDKGYIDVRAMLNQFPYLMQALDNPCLLKGKLAEQGIAPSQRLISLVDQWKFDDHGKLEALTAMLESYIKDEGRKVLLFDYHPLSINQLQKKYAKYNPLILHGQIDTKDAGEYRASVVEKFKTDPSCSLLIASSLMLATAVNLQEASRVIYFSRNWSLTTYLQSYKRAHRIGQEQEVHVSPMIFMNSLDVRLDNILEGKKSLNDAVFRKESLTNSEWASVLRGEL